MKTRNIVIVGGGIAGLTLARFLARDGHTVTIVERANDFSAQGHAIGFRGVGLQAIDKLGLRDAVEKMGRNHRAVSSFTEKGTWLRTVTYADHGQAVGGVVITQRGLLHEALRTGLPASISIKFGLRPTAIGQTDEAITVELSDATSLKCDILVGADGANSAVRGLVLPEIKTVDLGGIYVGMTINTDHRLPTDIVSAYYGKGRLISFFPISASSVAVVVYEDDSFGPVPRSNDPKDWAPYLQETYAGGAEPIRRVLAAIKPTDSIFHDRIRQVPPMRAAAGRVGLVGDAGYCPTFFAGNGAGIAAAGAYALAKSLHNIDDDCAALKQYERKILPFVAAYQVNARQLRNSLFSHSIIGNLLRLGALRFLPNALFARRAKQHYRGEVRLDDCL